MSRSKRTHEGGVVRSKLHGLETRMNARWSGHERTMVWSWTHDGLVTAWWSGHERTKVWTWTHEKFSCVHVQTFVRSCPDHRSFMSRPSCVHQMEKITCLGAVQILESEGREYQKILFLNHFFFMMEQKIDHPNLCFWNLAVIYVQTILAFSQKKNQLDASETGKCWKDTKLSICKMQA